MRTHALLAACSALALMAAPNDQGGDAGAEAARKAEEDAAEAEAAAAAKAEEDEAAKKAEDEAAAEAAAAAKKAEEDAAAKKADAQAAAGRKPVLLIWVQPGHESYFIGQPVEFPAADAEFLRAAGRARDPSKGELKAWKDARKAGE